MVNLVHGKPLRNISEAFKELAATVDSQTADTEVAPFSWPCSLLLPMRASEFLELLEQLENFRSTQSCCHAQAKFWSYESHHL
ncbi:hypothetical protein CJ030_MR6G010460 [Morella rubra]|uniref:Uncharacterized protein n=1 Tax=Morella rubra TaxID=262757 RepID=A0A6A1V8I3_9ROSI|nr:hypothetical protein CJ030_MR6G010460 [Morella rubra]